MLGCYDLVEKFHAHKYFVTEEAQNIRIHHPISHKEQTLPSVLGHLVAEYVRLSDSIDHLSKRMEENKLQNPLALNMAVRNRRHTAEGLLQLVEQAEAHNWIDKGTEREMEELKQKNETLERDYHNLKEQYQKLLKDHEGLRKLLGSEQGKVVDSSGG